MLVLSFALHMELYGNRTMFKVRFCARHLARRDISHVTMFTRFTGRLVYDICEYLAYHCDRWRPFWILRFTKSRPPFLEKCRGEFFDKYLKLLETIVQPHLLKVGQ